MCACPKKAEMCYVQTLLIPSVQNSFVILSVFVKSMKYCANELFLNNYTYDEVNSSIHHGNHLNGERSSNQLWQLLHQQNFLRSPQFFQCRIVAFLVYPNDTFHHKLI